VAQSVPDDADDVPPGRVRKVITAVCETHFFEVEDLRKKRRSHRVV